MKLEHCLLRSTGALALAALALAALASCGRPPAPPGAPATPPPATAPAVPAVDAEVLRAFEGRWARDDGDYQIEIAKVHPDGKADAAYFNPRPIHVARAEVTASEGSPRLFVLMRDVNYDGSYYSLRFDRGRDRLEGTYYQAAQRQSFQVTFSRLPAARSEPASAAP